MLCYPPFLDRLGRALVRSLSAPAGADGGAPFGRTIRDLDVSDCRLSDGALAALAEAAGAHCPTLCSLRLAHNGKGASRVLFSGCLMPPEVLQVRRRKCVGD